jgi:hypothetical protein
MRITTMSELPHQTPGLTAVETGQDSRPDDPTRRNVIAGAVAATAVAVAAPAHAQGTDADRINMVLFVLLSGALTGIAENKLAPGFAVSLVPPPLPAPAPPAPPPPPGPATVDLQKTIPGSDPFNVKQEYFDWVSKRRLTDFRSLLQIARDVAAQSLTPDARAQAIIDKVQEKPETKYLARSIVLMWYLGAWYDPANLRALAELPNPPPQASKFEVISPKAYTQSWALSVAQAHPMGYSQMQFGYWAHKPQPPEVFTGKALT